MGDGTDSFPHYLISQAINLIWLLLVWVILLYAIQPEGLREIMSESFYFLIAYFVIAISMFFICWLPNCNCQPFLIVMGVIGFIGGGIFLGIYFGIFFKPLNYTYLPSKDTCTITNIDMANFDGSEKYAVLNVKFTDEDGNIMNGYGCASSKKESSMGGAPYVYSYYKRDEYITCGENGGEGVKDIKLSTLDNSFYQSTEEEEDDEEDNEENNNNSEEGGGERRVLNDEYKNLNDTNIIQQFQNNTQDIQNNDILRYTRRNAKVGGSSGGGYSGGGSYSGGSSYSSSSYGGSYGDGGGESCTYDQDFTDIKLSAWHCIEWNQFVKDVSSKNKEIIYKNCYYTTYGDKDDAKNNAKDLDKKAQKMKDFYMVIFEDPPYYDRTAFLLLVGFCLLPFISFTHFCWIPYLANEMEDCVTSCCQSCNVGLKKLFTPSPKKNKQKNYQNGVELQNNDNIQNQKEESLNNLSNGKKQDQKQVQVPVNPMI